MKRTLFAVAIVLTLSALAMADSVKIVGWNLSNRNLTQGHAVALYNATAVTLPGNTDVAITRLMGNSTVPFLGVLEGDCLNGTTRYAKNGVLNATNFNTKTSACHVIVYGPAYVQYMHNATVSAGRLNANMPLYTAMSNGKVSMFNGTKTHSGSYVGFSLEGNRSGNANIKAFIKPGSRGSVNGL